MSRKNKKRQRRMAAREAEPPKAAASADGAEDPAARGSMAFDVARRAFGYALMALTVAVLVTASVSIGRAVLASQVASGAIEEVDTVLWSVAIGAGAVGGAFAFVPHMDRAVRSAFDNLLRASAPGKARPRRGKAGRDDNPRPRAARRLALALSRILASTVGCVLCAAAAAAAETAALLVSIGAIYSALGSELSSSWDIMLLTSAACGIAGGGPIAAMPHVWRALRLAGRSLAAAQKLRRRRGGSPRASGEDEGAGFDGAAA